RWEIDAAVCWQYAFPLAALAVLIALWWLRSRIGRGPLVAVLCFAATLAPALGFFDLYPFRYSYVADHFQYMACIGVISLAVSMGTAICRQAGQRGRALGALIGAVVLLVLGVCTWQQAHVYQNLETLWRDTLAKNPNSWMAHNNLSDILMQQGKNEEAIWHLEQALRLKPDDAGWHYNLGNALKQAGKIEEAIARYEQALRIKPDYAEAHCNLGVALKQVGKIEEAIAHYEQALRINPRFAEAHYDLGIALKQVGKIEEAIAHYEQALRIKPDYAEAHCNLGITLGQAGRLGEAIGHLQQALQIKPDYPQARSALVRLQAGQ
ncbi:MAG: tetratricopeptide repeat protein, partial [Verrucomicrobiia bacterium]